MKHKIGKQGSKGDSGPQGPKGDKGDIGQGINVKGQVASKDDLPTDGNVQNDAWQALDTMDVWCWTGQAWINVGPVNKGEDGEDGAEGPMGPVMDISTLPSLPE